MNKKDLLVLDAVVVHRWHWEQAYHSVYLPGVTFDALDPRIVAGVTRLLNDSAFLLEAEERAKRIKREVEEDPGPDIVRLPRLNALVAQVVDRWAIFRFRDGDKSPLAHSNFNASGFVPCPVCHRKCGFCKATNRVEHKACTVCGLEFKEASAVNGDTCGNCNGKRYVLPLDPDEAKTIQAYLLVQAAIEQASIETSAKVEHLAEVLKRRHYLKREKPSEASMPLETAMYSGTLHLLYRCIRKQMKDAQKREAAVA